MLRPSPSLHDTAHLDAGGGVLVITRLFAFVCQSYTAVVYLPVLHNRQMILLIVNDSLEAGPSPYWAEAQQ